MELTPERVKRVFDAQQAARMRAVRAARAAPVFPLGQVAKRVEVSHGHLTHALLGLPARGRCAALAARAADELKLEVATIREAVSAHRAMPPSAARSVAHATVTAPGTAGWGARSGLEAQMSGCRRVFGAGRGAERGDGPETLPCAVAARWADSESAESRVQAARRGSGPVLMKLAGDAHGAVLYQVAANPAAPPATLEQLAVCPYPGVRAQVAANPMCEATLLQRLCADENPAVRLAVMRNPSCPSEALEKLSPHQQHARDGVKLTALDRLARDHDLSVRAAAAANPSAVQAAGVLASDHDSAVREALAANPACPPQILAKLAACSNDDLAGGHAGRVRAAAAANHACPPDVLDQLIEDDYLSALAAVRNPNCPPLTLTRASETAGAMREAAAANPACPQRLLIELITDRSHEVASAATRTLHRRFSANHPLRRIP